MVFKALRQFFIPAVYKKQEARKLVLPVLQIFRSTLPFMFPHY